MGSGVPRGVLVIVVAVLASALEWLRSERCRTLADGARMWWGVRQA
jgi:hypothetical protein